MVDAIGSYVASECRSKNGVDEVSIAKLFGQRQELANLAWSCAVSLYLPNCFLIKHSSSNVWCIGDREVSQRLDEYSVCGSGWNLQ